jgi:hypothetical protein
LRTLTIFVAVLLGAWLVGWLGGVDKIKLRVATLATQVSSPDGRLDHWRDSIAAATHYLPVGSGLGTYRYAYVPTQLGTDRVWFYHAENQYLEALVEGGAVGLLLLISAILLMGLACRRLLSASKDPATFAFGVAGCFALASQVVHSCFDFALYMPANMAVLALICGAVAGRSVRLSKSRHRVILQSDAARREVFLSPTRLRWKVLLALPPHRPLIGTLAVLLLAGVGWALLETSRVAQLDRQLRLTDRIDLNAPQPVEKLDEAMASLQAAVAARMDDAEGQQRLAQLRIARYRAREAAEWQTRNPDGPLTADVWDRTSPFGTHGWASTLLRQNRLEELKDLQQSPHAQDDLAAAAGHLLFARQACPLLGAPHLMLAELAPMITWLGEDIAHLQLVHLVAPHHILLLREASLLELNPVDPSELESSERVRRAKADWRRLGDLSRKHLAEAIAFAARDLRWQHQVKHLLPEDPVLLVEMASDHMSGSNDVPLFAEQVQSAATLAELLAERADELVRSPEVTTGVRDYVQGMSLAIRGRRQEAIECVSRAVSSRSDSAPWRYRLALLLQSTDKIDLALHQATTCVVLDPGNPGYRGLQDLLIYMRSSRQ